MGSKKAYFNMINIICCLIIFLVFFTSDSYMYNNKFSFFIIFLSTFNFFACFVLSKINKSKAFKIMFLINIILTIIIVFYHILKINNLLHNFSSVTNFKNFILSTNELGIIIYITIQIAQIIFLPIPASIIAIAGAIIYGPLLGSLYCTIGVLLGSYLSFFIGRTLGYKIVCWIVGKDNAVKYASTLNNGKMFLGVAFLLPMFPDDILCLIAGLTSMSFKFFFTITTIFRPIGVICMCYFGSGSIIPFKGWGIPLWIVLAIIIVGVVVLSTKYQNKVEEWVINKFSRKKKKEKIT